MNILRQNLQNEKFLIEISLKTVTALSNVKVQTHRTKEEPNGPPLEKHRTPTRSQKNKNVKFSQTNQF